MPSSIDTLLPLALAPFAAAVVAPAVVRLLGARAGWLLALVPLGLFVHLLGFLDAVAAGEILKAGRDWVPSFGVRYAIALDGLSLLFALLITGIGTLVVVYSGGYLAGHKDQGRFFAFLFLFMGAMLGLVLADDLLSLFVFWEMTSISSFLLIGFDHEREAARRAAFQALVITGGGGLALLAGLLMIRQATGLSGLNAAIAAGSLGGHALYWPILLTVLAGAFTKSAQVPFNAWLPNAMEAPTPVSAYLHSATMVKAGVYLLMRMSPMLGETPAWSILLPVFGGATLLYGAAMALRQRDLKQILAQTTVASLGLLVLLVGLPGEAPKIAAALYLIAHALFKGGLFMIAGNVDHEAGTRDVTRLGGLAKALPLTALAAVLAAASMAGLPPLVGFIAKEGIYEATAHGGTAILVALVVAFFGNAMMGAAAGIVAITPFFGAKRETPKHPHEAPPSLLLGPLVLAAAGLAVALATAWSETRLVAPLAAALAGRPVEVHLSLVPHALFPAFALSVATVALAVLLFLKAGAIRGALEGFGTRWRFGPDAAFDRLAPALVRLARLGLGVFHRGRLEAYINVAAAAIVAALLVVPLAVGEWGGPVVHSREEGIDISGAMMLCIAVIGLVAVVAAKSRLVSIVSLGIQGFAVAVVFLLFGAPDLSFTQFMIETLSVVILALVMTRLNLAPSEHRPLHERIRDGALAIALGIGFARLLSRVLAQPFNSELSDFFAAYSRTIAHGRNIVNVIIVDFRGLDTLGEIAVVMVTGLAILALIHLRSGHRSGGGAP